MRVRTFFKIGWLLLAVFVMMVSVSYGGGVPQTLNYQGTLTETNGTQINGTKSVTFSLYTTLSGGTAFWTETQTVPVNKGQFSVVLGGVQQNLLDRTKFTGETYIGVTVGTGSEMTPRQKFTSVAYALRAADSVPKGVIVMWSGAVNQIPDGWTLCDGTNGTPDLRDRFIIGAGNTYSVADTGGNSAINLSHTHDVSMDANGSHSHGGTTSGPSSNRDERSKANDLTDTVGKLHTHSITADGSHVHKASTTSKLSTAQDIRPPYYALAFIMKAL